VDKTKRKSPWDIPLDSGSKAEETEDGTDKTGFSDDDSYIDEVIELLKKNSGK
jgi:hypothetical protein